MPHTNYLKYVSVPVLCSCFSVFFTWFVQGWCAALKVCLELFQEFFLFLFKYVFICAFFFVACMVYFEAKGVNRLVKVLVCVCPRIVMFSFVWGFLCMSARCDGSIHRCYSDPSDNITSMSLRRTPLLQ